MKMTTMKTQDKEKMATTMRQARQWAEMLQGLADVLSTLVEACSEQTGGTDDDEPNVYLRRGCDERRLRRVVAEALDATARYGVRHLIQYKYQWHALWRELEQRGWIGGGQRGLSHFCRQMSAWFPDVRVGFDYKGVAKGGAHRNDVAYEQATRWFRERL